jgi:hypothetical protein
MATASKKPKIFTKIKNERKGVRGETYGFPLLGSLNNYLIKKTR